MSTEKYTPPGEKFPESEESVKSYSQIWLYLLTIPIVLILGNLIIIAFMYPVLHTFLYAEAWTTIGANILGVLGILFISTAIPLIIRIGDSSITLIGFPYRYVIKSEEILSVIAYTGGYDIYVRNIGKYFWLHKRQVNGYKYISIGTARPYELYLSLFEFFLPKISSVNIIWENVPPQYKAEVIELVNRWREIKGIRK